MALIETKNILPKDGIVYYFPAVFSPGESNEFYQTLLSTIEWKHDEVIIFGRQHITKRKVAWYGDGKFSYTYSGKTKVALPWTTALNEIKLRVEKCCVTKFNSCLLNLYHDGNEGMGWHSDDEKTLGRNPSIASVTFGASRKFSFRHKSDYEKLDISLGDGSVLFMTGETQHFWLHSLPKSIKVTEPRINLTFRNFLEIS